MEYVNGVLEGEALNYDDDGNLVGKTLYEKGKREGEAFTYYPSGKVQQKANYKDDTLDGEVKFYAYDGTLIQTKKYEKGKRVDAPAPVAEKPAEAPSVKPAPVAPKKTFPLSKIR
jgi:antitoxin component YwqK of YwqJK toxin-antitoxin module